MIVRGKATKQMAKDIRMETELTSGDSRFLQLFGLLWVQHPKSSAHFHTHAADLSDHL